VKRDYYEVLGVSQDASDADIKRAFRGLARTLHPDVSDEPGADARFREVAEAYEALSDPETRARYDRFGHEGMAGQQFHTDQFMDLGNLGDLFGALFGRDFGRDMFTQAGPRAGADAETRAEITLEQAARGVDLEVTLDLVVPCEHCGASGAEPPTHPDTCPTCEGAGSVREVVRSPFGQIVRSGVCPTCAGRGVVVERPCVECRGRGRRAEKRTVSVAVPSGIDDGQAVRVAGAGHAGESGARAGDLYVHMRVTPDPRFERDGLDLVSTIDLTVAEAMLGVTREIETLDGPETLELKAGTQPGDVKVLRGRGMPSLRGGGRGALRLVVTVRIPRSLSKEQRELAERFLATETEKNYRDEGGLRDAIRRAFG
jgi:molecular chaperone DnaJ